MVTQIEIKNYHINIPCNLIIQIRRLKTQTDNAKSLNSRKSKCIRKLCPIYEFIYIVVDMRIGRLYEPKHESSSPQVIWRADLRFILRSLRLKIEAASRRASAVCWAEASNRGWFSWKLAVYGVVSRSHPARYIITDQNLPRWHLSIHPRRQLFRMSVLIVLKKKTYKIDVSRFNVFDAGCQNHWNQIRGQR